jgi:hypothetical protein
MSYNVWYISALSEALRKQKRSALSKIFTFYLNTFIYKDLKDTGETRGANNLVKQRQPQGRYISSP